MMSEIDPLYRGVNLGEPVHPYLKAGWRKPEAPEGFPHCVAMLTPTRNEGEEKFTPQWHIDFFNLEKGEFASHQFGIEIEYPWPWIEGFKPGRDDWDAIGIPHLC
ncbi:hypothetical protein [Pseudomonas aeruginosa]|uniref:hypothetical protein n=2 Tax=Pseudomonas aeruginosa TaxID=287 RepID=UPI0005B34C18|nr:hypothetical protein [Pseudomonas aeruginosa]MBG3917540.1 hypothetical protein [Pseudomonas aeruginosa]MBG5240641.1 hypothetical protein [Pseudomonas aeruginosa]MBV6241721.1 hypothetical protein [Pseudomonas aeruginosa]MCO1981804.1 hypothetical protein [Pseudomonas aeruginosa]MDA3387587.1 hypothetical protein [Pseudomonas aeruginosa]